MFDHFIHVVDAVVDHERSVTWTKPFGVVVSSAPDREAAVVGLVVRPTQYCTAPILKIEAEILLIPSRQIRAFAMTLNKDPTDPCYLCHRPSSPSIIF